MKDKVMDLFKKYKWPALVLVVGIALMLLPLTAQNAQKVTSQKEDGFSLAKTQEEMEQILSKIHGVGHVTVMLTLKSGNTLQLAQNNDYTEKEHEKKQDLEVIKLNRGSGTQEVVVTQETYPVYLGAVVVCDGADDASVCLAVTEAVSVLTGLSSDRITIAKRNEAEILGK